MAKLEVQMKNPKHIVFIVLLIAVCLLLAVSSIYSITTLAYSKSYSGISVNNQNVGKMTKEEILSKLKENYSDKVNNSKIVLKYKSAKKEISFAEIGVKYDLEKAVNEIMNIGREGNILNRLSKISEVKKTGTTIDLNYSYDSNMLKSIIDEFNKETIINVKDVDLKIENSKVTLITGHAGEQIDADDIYKAIEESIKSGSGMEYEVKNIITQPSAINVDDIYNKVCAEPIDAKATLDDNNKLSVVPHSEGRSIDKAELASIISEIEKKPDTERVLPVKFVTPKITTSLFNANLFKDTLSTYSTKFSTGNKNDANRAVNIKLASSKISGKILLPGDIFSFNDVVGPRTAEKGYQIAKVYQSGKIVDDIGGGICQVSTTLYNSILNADLETVTRRNHMFTVGYVPRGQDAAVSYGSTDFKFKNNTSMPIKILVNVTSDNRVVFSILGTNENPNKTIEITNVQVSTTPAPVKYVNDPNLPEGTTKVVDSGKTGYVVDTYKTVKINGEVVSKTKIHRSTYTTLAKTIKKGTKKVSSTSSDSMRATISQPNEEIPAAPVEGTIDSPVSEVSGWW